MAIKFNKLLIKNYYFSKIDQNLILTFTEVLIDCFFNIGPTTA